MKRISSRCGARCAANQSDLLGLSSTRRCILAASLGLLAGPAVIAATCVLPTRSLASDFGPTSSASAEISVTIPPRVERLKVEATLEGNSMWVRSNFDGKIVRYSKNLVSQGALSPQGRTVELDYGSQRVTARNGDILIFMPR